MNKITPKKSHTDPGNNDTVLTRIYASQEDIVQAKKLATNILRDYSYLLEQNQMHSLNNFLSHKGKKMKRKITQDQCMKIFNITKQAQNKLIKLNKKK